MVLVNNEQEETLWSHLHTTERPTSLRGKERPPLVLKRGHIRPGGKIPLIWMMMNRARDHPSDEHITEQA